MAGAASQLLYARIDAQRFSRIYSAKGRWGLLDNLLLTAAAMPSVPVTAAPAPAAAVPQAAASSVALEEVVRLVRRAAADILGEELDGASGRLLYCVTALLRSHMLQPVLGTAPPCRTPPLPCPVCSLQVATALPQAALTACLRWSCPAL